MGEDLLDMLKTLSQQSSSFIEFDEGDITIGLIGKDGRVFSERKKMTPGNLKGDFTTCYLSAAQKFIKGP